MPMTVANDYVMLVHVKSFLSLSVVKSVFCNNAPPRQRKNPTKLKEK